MLNEARMLLVALMGVLFLARTGQALSGAEPAKGSAPSLVRQGNVLLLQDQPAEALRSYEKAKSLRPEAREIAFDEALAHYRLGDFEKAREAFGRAAGGAADQLAADALYGLGTVDHSEALTSQDPKEAIAKIENAMRNYQGVLSTSPDHTTARDANRKAASYWRQLKEMLQQQQQQQEQDQSKNQDQDQQENQQNQQQQNEQQQQSSQENQQQQQQSQQQEQNQEQEQQNQQQEQEQQASAQKEQREQKAQPAEQKEEASREQAERKLREMVQAMRDRKKHRREESRSPVYKPTEKDW